MVQKRSFFNLMRLLVFLALISCVGIKAKTSFKLIQGVYSPFTMIIIPVASSEKSVESPFFKEIVKKLNNTGEFDVISLDINKKNRGLSSSFQYNFLKKENIDYVIKGSILSLEDQQYKVNIECLKRLAPNSKENPLLFEENYFVSKKQLLNLSAEVSDKIYQTLVKKKSIFLTKIAYVKKQRVGSNQSQYQLNIANPDGTDEKTLLVNDEPIMSPTWAPDGKSLAYVLFKHGCGKIYLQDIDSSKYFLIADESNLDSAPTFSKDGEKLAFVSVKNGYSKIYLLNLKTEEIEQLTTGYSIDTEPFFFSDGNSLLFTSDRDGSPQIYQYYFQYPQHLERLTFSGSYSADPSLTPDGAKMVFVQKERGMFGIVSQNLKTKRWETLTRSDEDRSPSIAPNGKMVVYESQYGNHNILKIISLDGRIKARLIASDGDLTEPAWSPFLFD